MLLLAKEIQLFPGLGIYSGIFAIYLQCPSNLKSRTRTANVVFYVLCLLYVLCAAAVVSDLLSAIFQVRYKFICKNINLIISYPQFGIITLLPHFFNGISIAQLTVDACCEFTSQCIIVRINHSSCIYHPFYSPKSSKIYRCWIVWGQNIRIMIIPSFLAITLLGQSTYVYLIQSRFQFIAYSYLGSVGYL